MRLLIDLDLNRIIQLFFLHGALIALFLYLSFKILQRNIKRINLLFSLFYLTNCLAVILNMVYALLFVNPLVLILAYSTVYLVCYAPVFILLIMIELSHSNPDFKSSKLVLIALIYTLSLSSIYFFLPLGGITINYSTNWYPIWSSNFLIFVLFFLSFGILAPTFYLAFKVYAKFKDETLRKRWIYFLVSFAGFMFYVYANFISNYVLGDIAYILMTIAFIILVPSILITYYSIGKRL